MGYAPPFTADLTGVYQTTPWAYASREREAEMHKKRLETMDVQKKAMEDQLKSQEQLRQFREIQMQQMQEAQARQQRVETAADVVSQVLQPVMMDVGNQDFEKNLQGAYAAGAEIVGPEMMAEYTKNFYEFLPQAREHRQIWAQDEIRKIDLQIDKLDKAAKIDRSTGPGPNSSRRIELDSRRKRLASIIPKAKQEWFRAGAGVLGEKYSGATKAFNETIVLNEGQSAAPSTGGEIYNPKTGEYTGYTLGPQDERWREVRMADGTTKDIRVAKNRSNRVTGQEPNEITGTRDVPGVGPVNFETYEVKGSDERIILWSPTDADGSVASGEDIYDFDATYVTERDHHEIMALPAKHRLKALEERRIGGFTAPKPTERQPTGLEGEVSEDARAHVDRVLAEADAARAADAASDQPGAPGPLASQDTAPPPQDNVFNPGAGGPIAQQRGAQTVAELPAPALGLGDLLGQTPGTVGTTTAIIGHPHQVAVNEAAMAVFSGNLSSDSPAYAAARGENFQTLDEKLGEEVANINQSFGNSFGNIKGAYEAGSLDANQIIDLASSLLQQGLRQVNIAPDQLDALSSRLATEPFRMGIDNTGAWDTRVFSSISQVVTGGRALEERNIRANAQAALLQMMVTNHVNQTYGAVRRHFMNIAEKEAKARGLDPREVADVVGNNKNFLMAHTERMLDKTILTEVLPDTQTMQEFINDELTINPKSEDEQELMRTIHFTTTMNGIYAKNYFDGLKRGDRKYQNLEKHRRNTMLKYHQVFNNIPDVDEDDVGMTSGVMRKKVVKNSLGETEELERVFRIYTNADGKGGAILYTPGFRTLLNGIYLTEKEFGALRDKKVEHYPEWFKVNMPGWI